MNNLSPSFRRKKTIVARCCLGLLIIACLIAGRLPSAAQDRQYAGTINRMAVKRMKAEFDAHGQEYCQKMRDEARPYIKDVCATLADTAFYNQRLRDDIARLRKSLDTTHDQKQRYALLEQLYSRFAIMRFDSAYVYARRAEDTARALGDNDLVVRSRANQMRVLTNSGFFREAYDVYEHTDTTATSIAAQTALLVAAFNIDFENGFFFPYAILGSDPYLDRMKARCDRLTSLLGRDSYIIDDLWVKMYFHETRYTEAVEASKRLMAKLSPASDYYAYALGNMGYNYMGAGDYANAAHCVAQSAITEIKRGSTEYPAARKMAEIAYIMGSLPESYQIAKAAMLNAEVYRSQYRYAELAKSYPKIDQDLNAYIENQKTQLTVVLVVLLVVAVLLAAAVVLMLRQRRTVHRQKTLIEKQVHNLSEKNTQIEHINRELQEAGHIKEVVLGQLIVGSANHQAAIEKLRKEVLRRLTIKDYEGVRNVFDSQKAEAFDSFYQIDSILLMLFPDFSERFNELLRPENRTQLRGGERLTTEMRIFALIRLGIHRNDDLARSLNYSVNTIKSYKTRVLAASPYDKDEFYRRLNAMFMK